MPDCIALAAGLGHTAFDEFTKGKGLNTTALSDIVLLPGCGQPVWGYVALKVSKA